MLPFHAGGLQAAGGCVGAGVGAAVGAGVGAAVGAGVGAAVGAGVGAAVGAGVGAGGGALLPIAVHRLGVHSGGLFTFQVLFEAGVASYSVPLRVTRSPPK